MKIDATIGADLKKIADQARRLEAIGYNGVLRLPSSNMTLSCR